MGKFCNFPFFYDFDSLYLAYSEKAYLGFIMTVKNNTPNIGMLLIFNLFSLS